MRAGLGHSWSALTNSTIDWQACLRTHTHTVVLGLLANGAPLDEARELAHDAFARLFEQWAQGRLTTLDFPGIAMRQAMYLLAVRRRATGLTRTRSAPLDEARELPTAATSPDEALAARQALQHAAVTLETFSPRARNVLEAVLASPDVPHRQLAEAEGLSLQRFRQVLCEVRARLRDALGRPR
jgi:RNA polymerase sigma-70 factor (ECF subfamily)